MRFKKLSTRRMQSQKNSMAPDHTSKLQHVTFDIQFSVIFFVIIIGNKTNFFFDTGHKIGSIFTGNVNTHHLI